MELKDYQKKTVEQIRLYLQALSEFKEKNEKAIKVDPDLAINYPLKAWERVIGTSYSSSKNALNEPLPNFYLKIPTVEARQSSPVMQLTLSKGFILKNRQGLSSG